MIIRKFTKRIVLDGANPEARKQRRALRPCTFSPRLHPSSLASSAVSSTSVKNLTTREVSLVFKKCCTIIVVAVLLALLPINAHAKASDEAGSAAGAATDRDIPPTDTITSQQSLQTPTGYGTITIIRDLPHDLGTVTEAELAQAKQAASTPSLARSTRVQDILTTPVVERTVIAGPGIISQTIRADSLTRALTSWTYSDWHRRSWLSVEAWQYGESFLGKKIYEARTKIRRVDANSRTGQLTSSESQITRTDLSHDIVWRSCGWSSTYRDFTTVSRSRHYRYEVGGIASFGYTGLGPVQPSCHKHLGIYLRVEGYRGGLMRSAWKLT